MYPVGTRDGAVTSSFRHCSSPDSLKVIGDCRRQLRQHTLTLKLQGMNSSAEPATNGTPDRYVLVIGRGPVAQFTRYCTNSFRAVTT